MKQGDEGRYVTKEALAVTVMRKRREIGMRMIRSGASTEEIMDATGVSYAAVKLWRRRMEPGADAPSVPVPPPAVQFVERGLGEMADVPLGAW